MLLTRSFEWGLVAKMGIIETDQIVKALLSSLHPSPSLRAHRGAKPPLPAPRPLSASPSGSKTGLPAPRPFSAVLSGSKTALPAPRPLSASPSGSKTELPAPRPFSAVLSGSKTGLHAPRGLSERPSGSKTTPLCTTGPLPGHPKCHSGDKITAATSGTMRIERLFINTKRG